MKKLFAVIMMFVALVTGVFGADKSFEKVQKNGKFIVGLDATFAPMGFRGDDGEIVGFDIDLAKEVAKRWGVEVEFKPCEWDGIMFDLNSGNIDMVWNGMTMTEERIKQAAFSEPYFTDGQLIFSRREAKVNKVSELEGKVVGLQLGSSADYAVQKSDVFSKIKEIKKYATNVEALMDLEAGRTDAVVVDTVAGKYYNSKRAVLTYSEESLTQEYYGVAMRKKDKALVEKLNETLNEMKADGTFEKISEKWFGKEEK